MARNKEKQSLEQLASKNPVSQWETVFEERFEKSESWLDLSMDIALAILDRLDELGETQEWLADELVVSKQQVSKLVKGRANLTLKTLTKLSYALGIDLIKINEEPSDEYLNTFIMTQSKNEFEKKFEDIINRSVSSSLEETYEMVETVVAKKYLTSELEEFVAEDNDFAMAA